MEGKYRVANIQAALAERAHPTVTMWNRQEGRPRTDNFKRALKAEVRDALWMLTRQWQLGELQGDDAGAPVKAKLQIATTPISELRAADGPAVPLPLPAAIPLETMAERRAIPMGTADRPLHLDLRLQLGRQFERLLGAVGLGGYVPRYRTAYRLTLPDPDQPGAAEIHAHREVLQQWLAVAGRAMDGYRLYAHLAAGPPNAASDDITLDQPGDEDPLDAVGRELVAWFERMYVQPGTGSDAWQSDRLEYSFSCKAAGDELVAAEYAQDAPEWYVFDLARGAEPEPADVPDSAAQAAPPVHTLLPAPIEFDGMPDTRWWAFEDRKTNFGDVSPSTTDLAKLLVMEFALVYANDWFVIPFRLPIGTIARVQGLVVTNSFGERHWIEPSGHRPADAWQRWRMFAPTEPAAGRTPGRPTLILPALTVTTQEGSPTEEVALIRDEMANMVWGIECAIPAASGPGRAGRESALETIGYHRKRLAAAGVVGPEHPFAPGASVSYLAMTEVPENWIPFLPVHVEGDNREIQLQRSKMLRILEGDASAPEPIAPRTSLLREGLDATPKRSYFVHEEEVPRAGIHVTQAFQRARWTDGQVYVWFAARKQAGRGEGSSGLAFDSLVDVKPR